MTSGTRPPSAGFTLVELIITLAMAAILIGIALPAFNEFLRQRTMIARINEMVVAVTYARSEAVRQGQLVSVVAATPVADNEWGAGYCVVAGNPPPGNCAGPVLRMFEGFDDSTLTSPGVVVLSFNARGLLVGGLPVAIELCSRNENVDPGRILNINRTGRADVAELECHP